MAAPSYAKLAPVYRKRWDTATVVPKWVDAADRYVRLIFKNRAKYEAVEAKTGVPWYFIAVTHMRESSCDFRGVLHNGEHIIGTGRKTRLVPAGRGPFSTWEAAAIDALRLHALHKITDWSIERVLYECERFNGFGYYRKGLVSPYVWAGTTLYRSGKYVRDGVYDPSHVDTQLGCAIVLKRLQANGVTVDINLSPKAPKPAPIPDVEPSPDIRESPAAEDRDEKPAVKSKTIWASIIGAASTVLAVVTDWRVIAVLAVAAFLFIIADRYLKLDIKGWFRS
jgi:lysozyme family protein